MHLRRSSCWFVIPNNSGVTTYIILFIIFVIYSYYIDFAFEIVWALLLSANPVNPLLEILAPSAGSNVVKRRQDVDGFTVPLPLMRSQRKNAEDV